MLTNLTLLLTWHSSTEGSLRCLAFHCSSSSLRFLKENPMNKEQDRVHWVPWPFLCLSAPEPLLHSTVDTNYPYSSFYLPFISLARFNARWVLVFLTSPLDDNTVFLYSSQVACHYFLPLVYVFFMSDFCQNPLVHPYQPLINLAWFSAYWDGPFLNLKEVSVKILSPGPSPI